MHFILWDPWQRRGGGLCSSPAKATFLPLRDGVDPGRYWTQADRQDIGWTAVLKSAPVLKILWRGKGQVLWMLQQGSRLTQKMCRHTSWITFLHPCKLVSCLVKPKFFHYSSIHIWEHSGSTIVLGKRSSSMKTWKSSMDMTLWTGRFSQINHFCREELEGWIYKLLQAKDLPLKKVTLHGPPVTIRLVSRCLTSGLCLSCWI